MKNKLFRLFLVLMVMTVTVGLVGCGQATNQALGDLTVTSSNVGNHTHDIVILRSAIQNPPAGQVIYTSTMTGSTPHTHTVTLTQQNLTDIQRAAPVTVTSSVDANHSHVWTILGTAPAK
jgi:hypothetical protein